MSKTTDTKVIHIIGNNNSGASISDGGRIKIRLFQTLLNDEGFNADIIDLHNWKKHLFSIINKIKKAIKQEESLVIMAGPNGSRMIIPIVYALNRKHKSRVVFCPVGIGTLDKVVRDLKGDNLTNFLLGRNFQERKDDRFKKYLSSLDLVVLENKVLESCYQSFYGINNTSVLTNFRVLDEKIVPNLPNDSDLHCVYLSRVCLEKGILDLVESVNRINESCAKKIYLDVYGDIQLKNEQDFLGKTNKYIVYKGIIDQSQCYELLSSYELFILPTKYHGEGTPGSLVESLISGTPVLVSDYSQSKELVKEKYNGYVFKMNSVNDLTQKLIYILNNKNELNSLRPGVLESAKQFIYKYIENDFLRMIGGKEQ